MVETVGVVADHRGGGLEQARARAVGELQVDPSCGGEVALEAQYVRQLGAPPAVDRLVRVPDHEHVVVSLGELAHEDVLREVRVLELVDQHAREAVAGGAARVGVLMQRADRGEQQVVEVEPVGLGEHGLIGGAEACVAHGVLVPVPVVGGRSHLHAVLDDAHPVQQRLRLVDPGVDVGVEHALAHDVHPFGLVDDPEIGGHPDGGAVLAEQVAAQAVEGGDPHGSRVAGGEHRAQPLRHLVGRLAGEGERGDAGGLATAGAHEVGDAGADHAGLSGPGAGDDEDRSVRGGDRFALAFVERGQELFMVVPGGGSVWNGCGHVGWDGTGRGGGRTIADLAGHAEVSPGDMHEAAGHCELLHETRS